MTTTIAERLGARLLDSAFTEGASLIRQSAGTRNQYGEFVPGATTTTAISLVTAPITGQERLALPEGLRDRNIRKFYLDTEVQAVDEGDTGKDGDVIEYGGSQWRIRMVQPWGGFWEAMGEQE